VTSTHSASGTPIEGAVALVTGGNRGFGRALVDELVDRGAARVYATSRSAQPSRQDDRIWKHCGTSATWHPGS
jgi:NAD(P)-dependent dehydrogenase (short-subunit alcohol dehydrogenase family)